MNQLELIFDNQVDLLFWHFMTGARIDRVFAFQRYGIADLRSRICNVEQRYKVSIERRVKPGKKYKEYWLDELTINKNAKN